MNLPSQKLFLFFIPIIIGLSIFVAFRNMLSRGPAGGTSLELVSSAQSADSNSAGAWTPSDDEAALMNNQDDQNSSSTDEMATGTVTDQVSQKLFSDYISLKESGTANDEYFSDVASNATNDIYSNKAKDPYTQSDLKILPGNIDASTLTIFANNVSALFGEMESQQPSTTMPVTNDITSPQFTPQMVSLSKTYSLLAKNLLAISIPQALVGTYLPLVNNYGRTAQEYLNASTAGNDPLLAVAAIKNIKDNQTEEAGLIQQINDYLTANGVIFSADTQSYIAKPN